MIDFQPSAELDGILKEEACRCGNALMQVETMEDVQGRVQGTSSVFTLCA